jgi:hypothetical protein
MVDRGLRGFLTVTVVLASLLAMSTRAQSQLDPLKDPSAQSGASSESDRELGPSDPLESANEPEDRLVILPEIKREGERFYLSSFKLPDKLTFAGQPVPLDNWQVRERIEYEFYQFLEDQGESIVLAKRTGRWLRASASRPPIPKRRRRVHGSSFPRPAGGTGSRAMPCGMSAGIWKCPPKPP